MALKTTTERESASKSLVTPSQREASQNPAQKSNQNHTKTYIRPIRDRGDRFPSFIDAFCPVCDCFRLGFERFFDRFCFLQHLLNNTLFFFLNACSSLFSALLIELETLRSNSQRDDDDARDQNLLYSFSRRERLKPPSRSLFLCFVSSLFFFLSDFVRRLLLYTRGLFYAESFISFTRLMRFKILSSVCSENCRRDSAPTKTLNKKVSFS